MALTLALAAVPAEAKEPRMRVTLYDVTEAKGTVKVTFHGEERAGCRERGVCSIGGTTTYSFGGKPEFGQVIWARQRKRTVAFYGFFETKGRTTSDVVAAGNPEHCVDRTEVGTDLMMFEPRSRRVRFDWRDFTTDSVFLGDDDQVFDTRCAGPHMEDFEEGGLPFADVPYRVFRSPRGSFTTTGSRPFAGGGFAGTVDWTLSYGFRFRGTRGGGWFAAPIG
jgi:hypothetical protein